MRTKFKWKLRTRELVLGERCLVMGIVNVTPDSFSDGGQFYTPASAAAGEETRARLSVDRAVEHALQLLEEGADILDVGGESTRPGSKAYFDESGRRTGFGVEVEEELARVMPVIEGIRRARPEAVISIDTYKSGVAERALTAGAEIVNDVSGGKWDPRMYEVVARAGAGYVLMHMRGRPDEWRKLPRLEDPVGTVKRELRELAARAEKADVRREQIMVDPGFGFGKNFEENYPLLQRFEEFAELGYPVLSGTSRKSFIGRLLAKDGVDAPVEQRLHGTNATVVISVLKGAHVVRVHEVGSAREAIRIVESMNC